MDPVKCPYCQSTVPDHESTVRHCYMSYYGNVGTTPRISELKENEYTVSILHCPQCNKETLFFAAGNETPIFIKPMHYVAPIPSCIPPHIAQDYREAQQILTLSPRASATLSRRCLQNMIRDFWEVRRNTLAEEIAAIEDRVPERVFRAMNALRRTGNIGAHPEADPSLIVEITPGEAERLTALIGMLIENWYVVRQREDEVIASILQDDEEHQHHRRAKQ